MPRAAAAHAPPAWIGWLHARRDSPRVAFLLRTVSMVASVLLALIWTRLLVRTMGNELYGLFLAFLAVAQLAGLTDLGLAGAMGVRVMHFLARGEEEACRRFLATARGLFLILAVAGTAITLLLAGQLPQWLGFVSVPSAGSLTLLFALGALGVGLTLAQGYFQNLNYVYGNVVWPIIPAFIFPQLASAAQWLLATRQAPLWLQYLPHLAALVLAIVAGWWMLKVSHPWLGEVRTVRWEPTQYRELASISFWVYLGTLGTLIYVTTDRLVINAFFGPEAVPAFRFNNKLPELIGGFLGTASFVALPGAIRRLLSPAEGERAGGLDAVHRLQTWQILSGCLAAMGYLFINDFFIELWLGSDFRVPLFWQVGFALIMALAVSGDLGMQLLGRLEANAIRNAGIIIGGTAFVNLGLSMLSAHFGYIAGVIGATVVAQSISITFMSWLTCKLLKVSAPAWLLRSWLLPLGIVALAAAARWRFPPESWPNAAVLLALNTAIFFLLVRILQVPSSFFVDEWRRFRGALF